MKVFRFEGKFKMGDRFQKFIKEVPGKDEDDALHRLLSDLGGKHRTKRREVKIEKMLEISVDEVENPIIGYIARRGS